MLSLLRNYTLLSTFRLRPSLLPVVTRHFLTTSPTNSPAKKASKEASSRASTGHRSDDKPDAKSEITKSAVVVKKEKPKHFRKKDLMPPTKRPLASFVAFVVEKKKERKASGMEEGLFADVLRECGAAWRKLSEAEKQSYAPSPDENEAYKVALKNWQSSLTPEARHALKVRRRRKTGSGHALFLSETLKDAVGNTFGEKMTDRTAVWKSLSSEEKAAYKTRASETLFGVRAERAAQRERALERVAAAKRKVAEKRRKAVEKKLKEKVDKQKKQEVEKAKKEVEKAKKEVEKAKKEAEKAKKAKKAEQKKAQIMKEELKKKKALDKMKAKLGKAKLGKAKPGKAKPGKTAVKTTA